MEVVAISVEEDRSKKGLPTGTIDMGQLMKFMEDKIEEIKKDNKEKTVNK